MNVVQHARSRKKSPPSPCHPPTGTVSHNPCQVNTVGAWRRAKHDRWRWKRVAVKLYIVRVGLGKSIGVGTRRDYGDNGRATGVCLPTLQGGRARLGKSDHGAQHREEEKEEEVGVRGPAW